ncbi:MAG TPA: zinc ribbon domain-containing protein [Myxococcaceae bacterium]|nr:zinc ribbon domain-containing protein [Myxococcaceae bacterium]
MPLRPVGDAVELAAEAARSEDPFAVPADRCPKCIGERPPDALSCPRCGLAYINYVPEETAPSPQLATAFRTAMEKWDEVGRHDAALGTAMQTGELSALGRLYRIRQAAAPLDPVARRGLEEVLRRAAVGSDVLRPTPRGEESAPRWQKIAVMLVGLAVALLMFVLLRQLMSA